MKCCGQCLLSRKGSDTARSNSIRLANSTAQQPLCILVLHVVPRPTLLHAACNSQAERKQNTWWQHYEVATSFAADKWGQERITARSTVIHRAVSITPSGLHPSHQKSNWLKLMKGGQHKSFKLAPKTTTSMKKAAFGIYRKSFHLSAS